METMVVNSKGSTVVYKQADLKYDLEKKFIMLTDRHTGNARPEAQTKERDNRRQPLISDEFRRKWKKKGKTN